MVTVGIEEGEQPSYLEAGAYMERLLELTFVLGIEAQKELFKSVRFGELIVQITGNYHTRCLLPAGQRHRSWPVLRMVSGPAA